MHFKYYHALDIGDCSNKDWYSYYALTLNDKRRRGAMTWCHNPSPFTEIPFV